MDVHNIHFAVLIGVEAIFADCLENGAVSFEGGEEFVHFEIDGSIWMVEMVFVWFGLKYRTQSRD